MKQKRESHVKKKKKKDKIYNFIWPLYVIIFYFIFLSFQRTPSFLLRKIWNVDPSHARPLMIGLAKDACPLGTVPIRRATKEYLIASKLLLNNFQPQAIF